MKLIDTNFIAEMHVLAAQSERQRMNYDLRTTTEDQSQRMLNVLEVGTQVPIHRHEDTSETVICIEGRLLELLYEEVDGEFRETERLELCPREGRFGVQIPKGAWHTIEVLEPSTIFEAKDGAFVPR